MLAMPASSAAGQPHSRSDCDAIKTLARDFVADKVSPAPHSTDIRIAVTEAAVRRRLRLAARRREWRLAGSGAAVGVPEGGAAAVPTDGNTETAP